MIDEKNVYKISERAKRASERFLEKLRNGEFKRDILPQSEDGEGCSEEESYKHFLEFLESDLFKKLIDM